MPDANPKFKKIPREESITVFVRSISNHSKVFSLEKLSDILYIVHRDNLLDIKVFLTNIYTVSLADVVEIFLNDNTIDAIVTMSVWNHYTEEAKDYCKEQNKGLFCFKEFLGALNYDGFKFINYKPKKH